MFTFEDQKAFAELSGDVNPLHLDRVASRRSIFGQPIVHGIHTVLWALDRWVWERGHAATVHLNSLTVSFLAPALLDELVEFRSVTRSSCPAQIQLFGNGSLLARIQFDWSAVDPHTSSSAIPRASKQRTPRTLSAEQIPARSGSLDLYLDIQAAARLFPHVMASFAPEQVATILATTRLVGVECPGLHSVYSALELRAAAESHTKELSYVVSDWDDRFRLAIIRIEAPGMIGAVKAFLRPEPKSQPGYLDLKAQVRSNEFANQRALVLGGSRGLGEVTAKLLAAGGAEVRITYHQGRDEALSLVSDILSHGGSAACFQFDVLNATPELVDAELRGFRPTHLYYFATPFIFGARKGVFSPRLFGRFCDYYVSGFVRAVGLFKGHGLHKVFYPSSLAIDEVPANMGEYAAAKAAGEKACDFLVRTQPSIMIFRPRLPRMATDQTASVLPVHTPEPAPIMLEHLRAFSGYTVMREEPDQPPLDHPRPALSNPHDSLRHLFS